MRRKSGVTVKRCPECKSKDIYRRSRVGDITAREKAREKTREKSGIDISKKTKTYRCIRCDHEFNNPLIEPVE